MSTGTELKKDRPLARNAVQTWAALVPGEEGFFQADEWAVT